MYLICGLVTGLFERVIWSACRRDSTHYTDGLHLLCARFKVISPQKQGWISSISVKNIYIEKCNCEVHVSSKPSKHVHWRYRSSVARRFRGVAGLIWGWIWAGLAHASRACQHTWPWRPSTGCRFLSAGSSYCSSGRCNRITSRSLFLVRSESCRHWQHDWDLQTHWLRGRRDKALRVWNTRTHMKANTFRNGNLQDERVRLFFHSLSRDSISLSLFLCSWSCSAPTIRLYLSPPRSPTRNHTIFCGGEWWSEVGWIIDGVSLVPGRQGGVELWGSPLSETQAAPHLGPKPLAPPGPLIRPGLQSGRRWKSTGTRCQVCSI